MNAKKSYLAHFFLRSLGVVDAQAARRAFGPVDSNVFRFKRRASKFREAFHTLGPALEDQHFDTLGDRQPRPSCPPGSRKCRVKPTLRVQSSDKSGKFCSSRGLNGPPMRRHQSCRGCASSTPVTKRREHGCRATAKMSYPAHPRFLKKLRALWWPPTPSTAFLRAENRGELSMLRPPVFVFEREFGG